MLDPAVHAALVVLFTWLINLLFKAIGLDLGNDIATGLAQVIVAYILSLLGLGLWVRATAKSRGLTSENFPRYIPPFT